jgi:hypothetical protein
VNGKLQVGIKQQKLNTKTWFGQPIANVYVYFDNVKGKLKCMLPKKLEKRLYVPRILNGKLHIDNNQLKLESTLHSKSMPGQRLFNALLHIDNKLMKIESTLHSKRLSGQLLFNGLLHIDNK